MKTFPQGGIHPSDNKITANCSIRYLPIPEMVTIPVSQHSGAPAQTIVKKGDYVKTGQVIAVAKGYISSYTHSSVSGKINKIDSLIDSSGYKQTAVFIDVEGDEWIESIDRTNEIISEIRASPEEITKRCLESGIVGLGGATFHHMLNLLSRRGKNAIF